MKLQQSYKPDNCPYCKELYFARLEVIRENLPNINDEQDMTIYEYCLNPACKEHDCIACEKCGKLMKVSSNLPHLPYCDDLNCKSNTYKGVI